MNKIFFYAIILIATVGCRSNKASQSTKSFTVNDETFKIFTGSDGHEYYEQNFYGTGVRYFHYPACEKNH